MLYESFKWFYTDDLKLYARNAGEIQSLLSTVNIFSTDIGMIFCTSKCTHFSLKRGKFHDVLHQEMSGKIRSDVFY